jgi:hypothetical protein
MKTLGTDQARVLQLSCLVKARQLNSEAWYYRAAGRNARRPERGAAVEQKNGRSMGLGSAVSGRAAMAPTRPSLVGMEVSVQQDPKRIVRWGFNPSNYVPCLVVVSRDYCDQPSVMLVPKAAMRPGAGGELAQYGTGMTVSWALGR